MILFRATLAGERFFVYFLSICFSPPLHPLKKKAFQLCILFCLGFFSFYGDPLLQHSSQQQYLVVGLQSQWYISDLRHPAFFKSAKWFISALASVQAQLDAEQVWGRLQWGGQVGKREREEFLWACITASMLLYLLGWGN